jgi:iron complex outermembrane recepter protein
VRGRDQDRTFGGQQRISLGASRVGVQDFRPKPPLSFGPDDSSNVRQITLGLQYNLQTTSGSMLSVAVQKADYRKVTDFANAALTDTVSRDKPWLFSANGTWAVLPHLNLYGGYVRGLEESAIAPDIASNRNEAPPALRTRQMDAGVRYTITPKLSLIAGVFEIKKPYFGVDAALRFTNLGIVANRGAELSLAGTLAKGLTVVAGGILIDPKISGAEVDAGRIGPRPVGSFGKRAIFNLDWKPAGQEAWSFDLALDGASSEMANRLNTMATPGRSNVNLGTRFRFSLGEQKFLFRAQLQNIFNNYAWKVSTSGGFTPTLPRTIYMQFISDI